MRIAEVSEALEDVDDTNQFENQKYDKRDTQYSYDAVATSRCLLYSLRQGREFVA